MASSDEQETASKQLVQNALESASSECIVLLNFFQIIKKYYFDMFYCVV